MRRAGGPGVAGPGEPSHSVPPGRYRVFVQAYPTNPAANDYRADIDVWGTSCEASPVRP